MKPLYYFGRFLQLVGLAILPSAIWVGQLGHNERGAIFILVGSILIFYVGLFFSRIK